MNNIEKYRVEKGVTQEKMAADLNVSQAAVAQWESGKRNPPLKKAKQISDYLGKSIDKIFFNIDYNNMLENKKLKAS